MNDTSVHMMWWDSYPYSSLSVFALHPMYLRLQDLAPDLPDNILREIEVSLFLAIITYDGCIYGIQEYVYVYSLR